MLCRKKVCKKSEIEKTVPVRRCRVLSELGNCSRGLFDEDFPTSKSLLTNVGYNVRGIRVGLDSVLKCNPDGFVSASVSPQATHSFCNVSAKLKDSRGAKHEKIEVNFGHFDKLPGLQGSLLLSNGYEKRSFKTEYRHPRFSLVAGHSFVRERFPHHLITDVVFCGKKGEFSGGVSHTLVSRSLYPLVTKKHLLDLCLNLATRSWDIFAQLCDNTKNSCADFNASVVKKMICPYFNKEMLVGVRLNGSIPFTENHPEKFEQEEEQEGEQKQEKEEEKENTNRFVALTKALNTNLTFATQMKLTDFSSAKFKISTNGLVGLSFSEQLSKYAHVIFGFNADVKKLNQLQQNMLSFTLTLSN